MTTRRAKGVRQTQHSEATLDDAMGSVLSLTFAGEAAGALGFAGDGVAALAR